MRVFNAAAGLDVIGHVEAVRQRITHATVSRFTFSILEAHGSQVDRDAMLFAAGDRMIFADDDEAIAFVQAV